MTTKTFSTTITNTGGRTATKRVEFSIPSIRITQYQNVTLDPSESVTVSFDVTTSNIPFGKYKVIISVDNNKETSWLEIVKLDEFEIKELPKLKTYKGENLRFCFDIRNKTDTIRTTDIALSSFLLSYDSTKSNISIGANKRKKICFDIPIPSNVKKGKHSIIASARETSASSTVEVVEKGQPLGYGNIFIFIDEASNYSRGNNYIKDLRKFQGVVNSDIQVVVFGVIRGGDRWEPPQSLVPSSNTDPALNDLSEGDVITDHKYFPDQIRYVHSGRPPSMNLLHRHGKPAIPSSNDVYVIVDSSGSVRPSDLEPTLTKYLDWMRSKMPKHAKLYYITSSDYSGGFNSEKWLEWAVDAMQGGHSSRWIVSRNNRWK